MSQDPVIIDLNRYLDKQRDYTQEEQLHDLDGFIEYAQANAGSDCAQAVCEVAIEGCGQGLVDMVAEFSSYKKVDELSQTQKDELLKTAMTFAHSVCSELMDGNDLEHRG